MMMRGAMVVALVAGAAEADIDKFQNAGNNEFHETANWLVYDPDDDDFDPAMELPDDDDRIIIPNTEVCEVQKDGSTTEWTVDTVEVNIDDQDVGRLVVKPGVTLILENDDSNCGASGPSPACPQYDHHHVDGVVEIEGTATESGTLAFVTSDHEIDGEGEISGSETNGAGEATIEIHDTTVTSFLSNSAGGVRGDLMLVNGSGTAVFRNEGLVSTDDGGDIILGADLDLEDVASATWLANGLCERLVFKHEELGLKGQIADRGLAASILVFEASVRTSGSYGLLDCAGSIVIGSEGDSVFEYCSFATFPPFNCDNPADGGSGNCPTSPYFVDESKLNHVCFP